MKLRTLLPLFGLLLLLTACAAEPNTLFATAQPEGAVMVLYACDGEKTTEYWLVNDALEREIIDQLTNTTATPLTAAEKAELDATFPIWGLDIGTIDRSSLWMSYSNGYLYNRDGEVYRFKFDFERLLARYPFEEKRQLAQTLVLCERYLVLGPDGWKPELMRQADEPETPADIRLDVTREGVSPSSAGLLEVTFRNVGSERWTFGQRFSLSVNCGGSWYAVPTVPDEVWFFEDIAYLIEPGGEMTRRYDLAKYGDLPAGRYRFETFGLTYEFVIE